MDTTSAAQPAVEAMSFSPEWIAILLALLVVGLIVAAVLLLRSGGKKAAHKALADSKARTAQEVQAQTTPLDQDFAVSLSAMSASFKAAMRHVKSLIPGGSAVYGLSRQLVVGPQGYFIDQLAADSDYDPAYGADATAESLSGVAWRFFDNGALLGVDGRLILNERGGCDEKALNKALSLMIKTRPKRPADGIVLALPATMLVQAGRAGQADQGGAKARADLEAAAVKLHQRLVHIRNTLGMRLPVYIAVTGCENVKGFSAYCSVMSSRGLQSILGWSNPNVAETAYADHWMDEAQEAVLGSLDELRAELFAGDSVVSDPDGLYLFPPSLSLLFDPLRTVLSRLFKPGVYADSLFFRGVYFCGDCEGSGAFTRDLFTEKIFAERSLARPMPGVAMAKSGKAKALRAAAVAVAAVWGLGLSFSSVRLDSEIDSIEPLLESISRDLVLQAQGHVLHDQDSDVETLLKTNDRRLVNFEDRTLTLLRGMSNVRTNTLKSIFIPTSWFSPVHENIRRSMAVAFEDVIAEALYLGLIRRAGSLTDPTEAVSSDPAAGRVIAMSPTETTQFQDLSDYVADMRDLESFVAAYNSLHDTRSLQDIADLVNYLFEYKLGEDFFENSSYYAEVLGAVRYPPFKASLFEKSASTTFRLLSDRFAERIFGHNVALSSLRDLQKKLGACAGPATAGSCGYRDILRLADTIRETKDMLAAYSGGWLSGDQRPGGSRFEALIDEARSSNLIDIEAVDDFVRLLDERLAMLREKLTDMSAPGVGRLLDRHNNQVVLRLAPGLVDLDEAIKEFSQAGPDHRYASGDTAQRYERRSKLAGLMWNHHPLEEAIGLADRFRTFLDTDLADFPIDMQQAVRRIGRTALDGALGGLVGEAQIYDPGMFRFLDTTGEERLRAEVENFREAVSPILQLLDQTDLLGLLNVHYALAQTADTQARGLLGATDDMLGDEGLYQLEAGGLQWWDGRSPLAVSAFEGGRKELRHYLDVQRTRLRRLASTFAEPVVAYFLHRDTLRADFQPTAASHGGAPLGRWLGIISALDRYDAAQVDNSITELEKFLLFEVNQITLDNFIEKTRITDNEEGDFFIARKNDILRAVRKRCLSLVTEGFTDEYERLARSFENRLQGRFPFAPVSALSLEMEPTAGELFDFFSTHDFASLADRAQDLERRLGAAGLDRARTFLTRMAEADRFFTAMYDDKLGAPSCLVEVDFRVERAAENGGNQIIAWNLDVGGADLQRFPLADDRAPVRWTYGNRVGLLLRFAKDAPRGPFLSAPSPFMDVRDVNVGWLYDNNWALPAMLAAHRTQPEDFPDNRGRPAHTLEFEVDTFAKGVGLQDDFSDQLDIVQPETVKVFLRLSLFKPPKKAGDAPTPLIMPDLPFAAPVAPRLVIDESFLEAAARAISTSPNEQSPTQEKTQ